jgi:hypothetical protein
VPNQVLLMSAEATACGGMHPFNFGNLEYMHHGNF